MHFTILFSNLDRYNIAINESDFSKKWFELFSHAVATGTLDSNLGFLSNLGKHGVFDQLIRDIENINQKLNLEIMLPKSPDDLTKVWVHLHTIFEDLHKQYASGKLGNNESLRVSIKNLNYYIHVLESKFEKDGITIFYPDRIFPIKINDVVPFKKELSLSDYDELVLTINPGDLILSYCEVGKEYFACFQDNLPLDYPGFAKVAHYSNYCDLTLDDAPVDINMTREDGLTFNEWLTENNIDSSNKSLGIGAFRVGKLVGSIDKFKESRKNSNSYTITLKE